MAFHLTEDQKQKYFTDGFLAMENFLTEAEADQLKEASGRLLDEICLDDSVEVFHYDDTTRSEYFAESVDKIRCFYEPDAVEADGRFRVRRREAVNKIGHALHWLEPTFHKHTFSEKVKSCVKDLGMVRPVVPQSMYIFKNAGVGGEVKPHQDATYLYLEPLKLVGLWFALDDVNLRNGCLHFVPGSHKGPLAARFVRNPDPNSSQMFVRQELCDVNHDDSQYVPVEMPKGSCVLIHGLVVHKSSKNDSSESRNAYTFHVIDAEGTKWAEDNWLQPTRTYGFPAL